MLGKFEKRIERRKFYSLPSESLKHSRGLFNGSMLTQLLLGWILGTPTTSSYWCLVNIMVVLMMIIVPIVLPVKVIVNILVIIIVSIMVVILVMCSLWVVGW